MFYNFLIIKINVYFRFESLTDLYFTNWHQITSKTINLLTNCKLSCFALLCVRWTISANGSWMEDDRQVIEQSGTEGTSWPRTSCWTNRRYESSHWSYKGHEDRIRKVVKTLSESVSSPRLCRCRRCQIPSVRLSSRSAWRILMHLGKNWLFHLSLLNSLDLRSSLFTFGNLSELRFLSLNQSLTCPPRQCHWFPFECQFRCCLSYPLAHSVSRHDRHERQGIW